MYVLGRCQFNLPLPYEMVPPNPKWVPWFLLHFARVCAYCPVYPKIFNYLLLLLLFILVSFRPKISIPFTINIVRTSTILESLFNPRIFHTSSAIVGYGTVVAGRGHSSDTRGRLRRNLLFLFFLALLSFFIMIFWWVVLVYIWLKLYFLVKRWVHQAHYISDTFIITIRLFISIRISDH